MPQTIGIVGIGFLGRGIAACLLSHQFEVIAFDAHAGPEIEQDIQAALQELLDHAEINQSILSDWRKHYHPAKSLAEFAPCDFVIESVSEDPNIKREVFTQLETIIRPDIPLTSNTSSIPISLMQKWLKHPNRFAGMHWAGPAHIYRFMEITRGEQTDDATVAAVTDLAERAGKDPAIILRDIEGFIVNRLCYAMYREAFYLLENGIADIESIDKSFRNVVGTWAAIAGPFRWMDLTSCSIYAEGMRQIFPTLCNSTSVPLVMNYMEARTALGTKNLKGFYDYTEEEAEKWNNLLRGQAWVTRLVQGRIDKVTR
jgi:3-hydroxybutyryl-CoA dehydrogenase